jgi:hypothetical protein
LGITTLGAIRETLEIIDERIKIVMKKAAVTGEYAVLVMLDYPSQVIKDGSDQQPVEDLARSVKEAHPQWVYTHNLADKHDTHVGAALKVIAAICSLPEVERPRKLFGCEVWRDLDWMVYDDKVSFDLSAHDNLQAAVPGVFDSQTSASKRCDLASPGHRRANVTFFPGLGNTCRA